MWNYRGYDLIYKLCGCPCGHGHVRKLLEAEQPEEAARLPEPKEERKKKKSANLKPKLNTAAEGVDKTRTRKAERGGEVEVEGPGEERAKVPGSFWSRDGYFSRQSAVCTKATSPCNLTQFVDFSQK